MEAKPRPEELAAMKEQHVQPTAAQQSHQQHASEDKSQFAKVNGGHPTAVVMNKVGGKPMNEHGQVAASSKLGNQNPNRAMQNKPNTNNVNKPANQQIMAKPNAVKPANASKPMQPQRAQSQQHAQRQPQRPKPQPQKPHENR